MVKTSKSSPTTTNNIMIEKEEDRISMLPKALIHHIMSFMNLQYAVQTLILSKRWVNIWKSLPFLKFYIYGYGRDAHKLKDFFNRVLLSRDDCSIKRFRVTSHSSGESSVNRWIDAAVKNNVEEVTIELSEQDDGFTYKPSPRLLNCKSLEKLTLQVYCENGFQAADVIFPQLMSLPQLKFMCLDGFSVYDVESIKRLLSSCPLLVTLNIRDCDIQTDDTGRNFDVESLSLKQFAYTCEHGSSTSKSTLIRLSAPNLEKFTWNANWKHEYDIQNCSDHLSDVNIDIQYHYEYEDEQLEEKKMYARRMVKLLVAIENVIRLELSTGFLEVLSKATDLVKCQLPCLCNLQSLRLKTWFTRDSLRSLAYLLTISPNIKTLILIPNPQGITWNHMQPRYRSSKTGLLKSSLADVGDDWEVGFSLPGMLSLLNIFRIYNVQGCDAEIKILRFVLKNAKALAEVSLYPCSTDATPCRLTKQFSSKLKALPRASSRVKITWEGKESIRI